MHLILAAAIGILAAYSGNAVSQESPKNHASWWIQTYGLVDTSSDELASRAVRIFERVAAAADKKANRLPRLVIIQAQGDPFAVALPDGSVILTKGGLDICYRDVSLERGDARLAFVLGHELAHLAKDHFWHLAAFSSFKAHEKTSEIHETITPLLEVGKEDLQAMELQADAYGLQYVTMAGYDPQSLLTRETSFFKEWVSQVSGGTAYATHPGPAERAEFLISQLMAVADELDYFHFGVRLHQLGRYEDAVILLGKFLDRFPGREVLNNLGLSHFQLAMRSLSKCDGALLTRFKLPLRIDPRTRASRMRSTTRTSGCYQAQEFQRHYRDTVRYLKASIEKDPWYLPARINLVTAYITTGNGAQALALAEDALKHNSENADVLNAKAVALHLYGLQSGVETTDSALRLLSELCAENPRSADAVYNQAAILSERGRTAAATAAFQSFLEIESNGQYAQAARDWLRVADDAASYRRSDRSRAAKAPIPLGQIKAATRERHLEGMRRDDFVIGDFRGVIYKGENIKALSIGSVVEIVEEQLSQKLTRSEAHNLYGVPAHSLPTATGEILIYDDFALDMVEDTARSRIFFTPGV